MKAQYHALTSIPFLLMHEWVAAFACLAADVTWVPHEIAFRVSGAHTYKAWESREGALRGSVVVAYRIAHSLLTVAVVTAASIPIIGARHAAWVGGAWVLHIACDCPTHRGIMQQRPFYPVSMWRWPWIFRGVR